MTAARAEEVLTDPSWRTHVDAVVRRTDQGLRIASATGSVDFVETHEGCDVVASTGADPIHYDDPADRATTAAEIATPVASIADHATPGALDSIAQYFHAAHAPDLVVLHGPSHRFRGNVGEHGSLTITQARAPFIAAGPGIIARGEVAEHLRTVDVAPTVAALLGVPVRDGVDGRGQARAGLRLAVQDGEERTELLDPESRPDHVVVFLWDGANPNELHDAAAEGDAPNIAALIERGTSYRHGCLASLPTATLANHTAACTGVLPGHSGVLHNTWYDRERSTLVDLLDLEQMVRAREHLRPGIETVHQALKRAEPHARTATTYEYIDTGADFSTYALMAAGAPLPPLEEADRRRHRTTDFMGEPAFRQMSVVDAHSTNQARRIWAGELGDLPRYCWFTLNLTDAVGHASGPHSEMTRAAIRDTDGRMGDVLAAIDRVGRLDRTAVVMLADHGMQQIEESDPHDLSVPLREAGIDHLMVDAQYVYL